MNTEEVKRKYMDTVKKTVGFPALYEQLAEEATELAHAALKLSRVLREENPTPVDLNRASANLVEELSDLQVVCDVLGIESNDIIAAYKLQRWINRLTEKQ